MQLAWFPGYTALSQADKKKTGSEENKIIFYLFHHDVIYVFVYWPADVQNSVLENCERFQRQTDLKHRILQSIIESKC